MDRDLLIDTLARVLAGLQVPLSLDGRTLTPADDRAAVTGEQTP